MQKVVLIEVCTKLATRQHPVVLHSLKIQKYKKKENNEGNNTKENKPEELDSASSNTGSDFLGMYIVLVQIISKDTSKTVHTYALLDSCSQSTFIFDQLIN